MNLQLFNHIIYIQHTIMIVILHINKMWPTINEPSRRRLNVIVGWLMYPTEKWDGAWSLREMGSTWVEGTGEGPAPQAGSKISSQPPTEEETTASWSK